MNKIEIQYGNGNYSFDLKYIATSVYRGRPTGFHMNLR